MLMYFCIQIFGRNFEIGFKSAKTSDKKFQLINGEEIERQHLLTQNTKLLNEPHGEPHIRWL